MVRKHTPEELAEATRILKEAEPLFKERGVREQAEKERWANEIAMLERRVKEDYVDVDIGGGDMLAIRTCLSEPESAKLGELYKKWYTPADTPDKAAITRKKKVAYEIVELVTANPIITKEWLQDNPDKFATEDAVNAILSYMEQWHKRQNERAAQILETISFRAEQARPELRGVPAPSGNHGPTVVRGSASGDPDVLD